MVGVAPEGTRSYDGILGTGHDGAAWLAGRTDAVIVPAAMWGHENVFGDWKRLRRPRVIFMWVRPCSCRPRRARRAAKNSRSTLKRSCRKSRHYCRLSGAGFMAEVSEGASSAPTCAGGARRRPIWSPATTTIASWPRPSICPRRSRCATAWAGITNRAPVFNGRKPKRCPSTSPGFRPRRQ